MEYYVLTNDGKLIPFDNLEKALKEFSKWRNAKLLKVIAEKKGKDFNINLEINVDT